MKQYVNITETLKKYERALKAISKASDQANAIHLKTVAQTALDLEEQSEIAEYDNKLRKETESDCLKIINHHFKKRSKL